MKNTKSYIADLHVHSRYSRATSKDCSPETLELWARRKGIDIVGTGDFTHPAWREELKEKLIPAENGLYVLKEECRIKDGITDDNRKPRFVVSGEISSIYKKGDRVRKIHNLILLSSLEDAENLSHKLETIGNIHSDGRPILGLDSRDLLEITLEICKDAIFVPAHIWTPHFSLFGAFSGFDRIEDCFEDLTPYIHALETGLSSDPAMNWRLSALDRYQLISNSDAHSPSKLGREANLLDIELSYQGLEGAIQRGKGFCGTIEFFPEEGKYFLDGHRKCNLSLTPAETKKYNGICPVCGRKITIGVLHRVEELADREEGFVLPTAKGFESLVPLPEVIASAMGCAVTSSKVNVQYEKMLRELGAEFSILREIPLEDIRHCVGNFLEEGIHRLRTGQVERTAGYDGEYGVIQVLKKEETDNVYGQVSLFDSMIFSSETAVTEEKEEQQKMDILKEEEKKNLKEETKEALNEEQMAAVCAKEEVISVIAGPGTGKTKTLIERIVYLISECQVNPAQIRAVTFTNKAAQEMRERLEKRLSGKKAIEGIEIGTFHGICYQMLLKSEKEWIVIEDYQANQVIKEIIQQKKLKISAKNLLQEISRYKNRIPFTYYWKEGEWEEIIEEYQKELNRLSFVDFDDLLRLTLEMKQEELPKDEGKYLFVDEFQDMNEIQYELVKKWKEKGKGLFVIGDPDQAIYGFRGSNAKYFLQLKKDFKEVREIRLVKNYRSTKEIIDCALCAIKKENQNILIPFLKEERGEEVTLVTTESELSEGIYIAKQINAMTGGMDMLDIHNSMAKQDRIRDFDEIAVLYRTHQQAKTLEMCLRKESIPCKIVGRDDFLDDKTVQEVISFFRFLLEPRDLISLRIYLQGIEGYTEDVIEQCLKWIKEKINEEWTEDILEQWEEELGIRNEWMGKIRYFYTRVKKESPQELLKEWKEKNGLEGEKAFEKLEGMAVFYKEMKAFLDNLRFGQEGDFERSTEKMYHSSAVSLMTLHAAKGLEFPVVFLCGIKKGTLPLEIANRGVDIEEERRLFYVGITRAKEELILLTSKERSVFLEDLKEENFHKEKGKKKKKKEETQGVQMSLFDLL